MGCVKSKSISTNEKLSETIIHDDSIISDQRNYNELWKNSDQPQIKDCEGNGLADSQHHASANGARRVLDRISGRIGGARYDSRVMGKYDVKAVIGKGSFSKVLMVEEKSNKCQFAMKVMTAENGSGPFENELSILSRIDHAYVIKLIEIFRTDKRVYVVMELAMGGELYDRIIDKGRFSEEETAVTLRMILDGLSYLHGVGVTHRDVKPENILYHRPGDDSRLMITDFGLAHQSVLCGDEEGRELMMDPCGTPEYIAPEVLAAVPYTNMVDMWAVGVIAFILLSGSMPFDDEDRRVLYRRILRCKYHFYPELWWDVSDEAKYFVSSLLCIDWWRRLTADQALQNAWLQSLSNPNTKQPSINPRPIHKSHSAVDNRKHRTRSTRSVRSVTRSDAGRRVNKAEVERLQKDPEIKRILVENCTSCQSFQQDKHSWTSSSTLSGLNKSSVIYTTDYGLF